VDRSRLIAKNLYEIEGLDRQKILDDLRLIKWVFDAGLTRLLENPLIPKEKKKTIVQKIVSNEVAEESLVFLNHLFGIKEWKHLNEIISCYEKLLREKSDLLEVEATVASQMSQERQKELQCALATKYGKTVVLKEIVDPSIIGGVRIKVGDVILDNSIQGQIEQLKSKLAS
jgi:F-type H+-transporting ATPase subunit delta